MSAAVRFRGVSQAFSTKGSARAALATVDLDIAPGEFVAVVGPSGCGKSTLLDLVAGHAQPASGAVRWEEPPSRGPVPTACSSFRITRSSPGSPCRKTSSLGCARLEWTPRAPRRRPPARGSREWASPMRLSCTRTSSRAECGSARRSPAPSRSPRRSSSWTSPSRPSMHPPATGSTSSFRACGARRARPSSSSPTTCARPSCSGDRVVVMSSGPGRIIADVPVNLSAPPRGRVAPSGRPRPARARAA